MKKTKAESVRNQRGRQLVACALLGGVLFTGCTEDDPRKTIEVSLGDSGTVSDWLDVAIREAVAECESDESLEEVRFTFKRSELESGIAREYYIGNFPGGITCQSRRPTTTAEGDTTEADTSNDSTTTEAPATTEAPTTTDAPATTEPDAGDDDTTTTEPNTGDDDAGDDDTTSTTEAGAGDDSTTTTEG